MKKTRNLSCVPNPSLEVIQQAADILRGGGLVAFPTETVYGLGANALDPVAVAGIFAAKGRPSTNPVIVHIADIQQVSEVVSTWSEHASLLADRFWPGPLTLVLPRNSRVPDIVTASGPTVAIRIPAHPLALSLLREAGVPVAAPSANRSNRLSPTRADHVLNDLDGLIDIILDGGPTTGGIESTVLDITSDPPRILRPGLVDPAAIEDIIGPIERPRPFHTESGVAMPSPGMLQRHYSPRTPLDFAEDDGGRRVAEALRAGFRVAWLRREPKMYTVVAANSQLTVVYLPSDPVGYAAELYAVLHQLDVLQLDRIIVEGLPREDAWLGIRDRLTRAAS